MAHLRVITAVAIDRRDRVTQVEWKLADTDTGQFVPNLDNPVIPIRHIVEAHEVGNDLVTGAHRYWMINTAAAAMSVIGPEARYALHEHGIESVQGPEGGPTMATLPRI